MSAQRTLQSSPKWTGWLFVLAFWTLLGLFFVSETYLAFALNGPAVSWRTAVRYELPGWYIWGALSPLIVLCVKHVPLRNDRLAATIIFHAGASHRYVHSYLLPSLASALTLKTDLEY